MRVVIRGEVDAAAVRQLADLLVEIGAPGVVATTGSRMWVRSFCCMHDECFGFHGMHAERREAAAAPVKALLRELPLGSTIVHGAARGADDIVDHVARELGFAAVRREPADWSIGRGAGPARNARIVRVYKPRLLLAFNVGKDGSAGTNDMIRRSLAALIPVFEVRR